jgi:hypothetical protein
MIGKKSTKCSMSTAKSSGAGDQIFKDSYREKLAGSLNW